MINQKKSHSLFQSTVISGLFAAVLSMTSFAHAEGNGHGTVKFIGEIIDAACSIDPDSADQTVDLGQVSARVLSQEGGESATRPFHIHLTGCSTQTAKTVSITFNGNAADQDKKHLAIEGTAKGAAITINNQHSGEPIILGVSSKVLDFIDGDNTLDFGAKMVSLADQVVFPGKFSATTNFILTYQ